MIGVSGPAAMTSSVLILGQVFYITLTQNSHFSEHLSIGDQAAAFEVRPEVRQLQRSLVPLHQHGKTTQVSLAVHHCIIAEFGGGKRRRTYSTDSYTAECKPRLLHLG